MKDRLVFGGYGDPEIYAEMQNDLLEATSQIYAPTELGKLFESCWSFGINPLPQVRKLFKQYEWQYHNFCDWDEDRVKKVVTQSDYLWDARGDCGDFDWVVSAREKKGNRAPRMIFVCVDMKDWGDKEAYKIIEGFGAVPL